MNHSTLTELVGALVECAEPVTRLLDDVSFAIGPYDIDAGLGLLHDVLSPLACNLAERDLRAAIVVLEAATPLILENLALLSPVAETG